MEIEYQRVIQRYRLQGDLDDTGMNRCGRVLDLAAPSHRMFNRRVSKSVLRGRIPYPAPLGEFVYTPLQFCSFVINYDLPWTTRCIEERIGRRTSTKRFAAACVCARWYEAKRAVFEEAWRFILDPGFTEAFLSEYEREGCVPLSSGARAFPGARDEDLPALVKLLRAEGFWALDLRRRQLLRSLPGLVIFMADSHSTGPLRVWRRSSVWMELAALLERHGH